MLAKSFGCRCVLFLLAALVLVLPTNAQAQTSRSNQAREVNPVAPAAEPQPPVPIGGINVDQMLSPDGLTPTIKMMILMTLLSLAPSILIMTTSFIRFIIVFGLLRQALGTQQLPPNQVITALSLFLTLFLMQPVWQESYTDGIAPYVNHEPIPHLQPGEDPLQRVCLNTFRPVQRFMSQQIHKAGGEDIVFMLIDYRRPDPNTSAGRQFQMPESFEEVEPSIIVTAFMLSELKTAFVIGFQIFLPFVVIDLVVSILLTSMGLMMLPPTLVSLPFKLLLFVLIDGWVLTVKMLLSSVDPSFG